MKKSEMQQMRGDKAKLYIQYCEQQSTKQMLYLSGDAAARSG
jgi:hypothetical protein